jgi:hypothetical protein
LRLIKSLGLKKIKIMATNIGCLFSPEPNQWGLRGDPFLWREMAAQFSSIELPASSSELAALLYESFTILAGNAVSFSGHIQLPRHSHGGMSSGGISTNFWRERGIPLLLARFETQ